MNFVALRMLIGDRLKYISLVAGVAFAALLITQQASIFTGYALRTTAWIRDTGQGDLWVMDDQVEFTEDGKKMSDTALFRVRGVEGVAWAVPMFKGYIQARLDDGRKIQLRLIGLDDATLTGGPPQMLQGELADLRRDRAVIVNAADLQGELALKDRATGQTRPLGLGDRLDLNDNDLEIVGVYNKTPEFFWEPVLYTTYSRALAISPRERRVLQYVLVKAAPGVDLAELSDRINAIPGLKAMTGREFEAMTMNYVLGKTGILINFGMTIGLGFVIGLLVSGQTLYTFVLDNLRHFAALKAMGVRTPTLVRMIIVQVVTVSVLGFGVGVGGAALTGLGFSSIGLAFQMPLAIPVAGGLAIVLCCVAAGLISVIRVIRLEPAVVFKG